MFIIRLNWILGGGSGIGKAVCHVLAREGARVVVADLNHMAAEDTRNDLDSMGKTMIYSSILYIDA